MDEVRDNSWTRPHRAYTGEKAELAVQLRITKYQVTNWGGKEEKLQSTELQIRIEVRCGVPIFVFRNW